jgi:predicted transcriptional regulator YdeE
MNAEMVTLENRYVMGSVARINPSTADYTRLWSEGFDPHEPVVAEMAVEPGYYGIYYVSEQEGLADFLAGMVVGEDACPPEGLVLRPLPGGVYARFDVTLATIQASWSAILDQWLPALGYVEDLSRPGIEYFAPDMGEGPEAPVTIYVPVVQKE